MFDNPFLVAAIVLGVLAVIAFGIHRAFPAITIKSAEAAVKAEAVKVEATVKADLPDVEADIVAAGQRFIKWATDTTKEVEQIAAAQEAIVKKNKLAAQTIAVLSPQVGTPPSVA